MPYPTYLPTDAPNPLRALYGPITKTPAGVRFIFSYHNALPAAHLNVYRSDDFGVSWTLADPLTVKAVSGDFTIGFTKDANFPTVPKVYVAWTDPVLEQYTLSTFNLDTELWEADIPSVLVQAATTDLYSKTYLAHRAGDNKVILLASAVIEVVGVENRYRAQIAFCDLAAATWSAYTQVGTAGGDDVNYFTYGAVSGAGGLTHLFLGKNYFDNPLIESNMNRELLHISLTAADALSANQVIDSFMPAAAGESGAMHFGDGPISRVNGASVQVLMPYIIEHQVNAVDATWWLKVAAADSADIPVWGIDTVDTIVLPSLEGSYDAYKYPALVDDNGTQRIFWCDHLGWLTGDPDVLNTADSPDGLVWGAPALFWTVTAGTGFDGSMATQRVGSYGLFANLGSGGGVYPCAYWDAPAAPPANPVSPFFLRTGKPYTKCGNVWDWCLKNSECPWYLVDWSQHGCIPVKCWRLEDNPLHSIPEQGREFHKFSSIPLPALPATDTRILSFSVPLGYDGIIYSVLCKFTGPGYINGSGDLIWRFRMNDHWIKSLHSIPTELGDYTAYLQLDDHIRVYSGQLIRTYGWVGPASGLVGGSMLTAVQGWYFPSQFAR